MVLRLYRQGDILIVPVNEIPEAARPLDRENGRIVLAHGEVTGHAHAIVEQDAELVGLAEQELITPEQAHELYLHVYGTSPVALVHEEHSTIQLPPGKYEVRRQREYAPDEIRTVAD